MELPIGKKLVLAEHQPNFLPYLGFFYKMREADIFVIMDDALFNKRDYHHRNQIRIGIKGGKEIQSKWVGVPIHDPHDYIKYVKIKREVKIDGFPWNEKLLATIKEHYKGAKYYDKYYPDIEKIFNNSDEYLVTLNMKLIQYLKEKFEINTPLKLSSELKVKPEHYEKVNPSEMHALICKACKADTYLSGPGGRAYMEEEKLKQHNIKVTYQTFEHPEYPQNYEGFLPYMGAIDALFNEGKLP